MFGLAGLSLQKIKIALVGSGRRSEDFRGPTNLRSYIWVSWLFHFTNRSVYYGWCQDDQSSRKKFVKTQRVLKIQISSYQKAEISSKKSQFKISWLRRVWLHSTVPVTRKMKWEREKKSLVRKRIIVFGCLSKLSWLLWVILELEDWLQKKDSSHWRSGCRR